MATIDPDLPVSYDTDISPVGSRNTILMDDNTYHFEDLSDNSVASGQIVFIELTEAQRDTVMTFYTTNKDVAFDYLNPHDGVTYTLYFADPPPQPKSMYNPPVYTITYTVVGE